MRIPFTKDFVPVTFNISKGTSQSLCQPVPGSGWQVRSGDAVGVFASFASLSGREKAKGGKDSKKETPEAS